MFSDVIGGAAVGACFGGIAGGLLAASEANTKCDAYRSMGYNCSPNGNYIIEGVVTGALVGGIAGGLIGAATSTSSNGVSGLIANSGTNLIGATGLKA